MTPPIPRVLLTNDDGPPGPESPYIFALSLYLARDLGWDVKVVVPSSQKSWIGKAFHIKEIVKGRYYYPREPDGLGESSDTSRPLRDGEVAEWILLDGTPATCANVGLHNIYPGQIDLVISGPNLGRNTSAAFALSSGTIGAALSASLCRTRAIALSYGTFLYPTPTNLHPPAHRLACAIVSRLWHNWGADPGGLRPGEVDLYNINIPMIERLLSEEGVPVAWANMWRNSYGRLFQQQLPATATIDTKENIDVAAAGPGSTTANSSGDASAVSPPSKDPPASAPLVFKFAPDFQGILKPDLKAVPEWTDAWAIHSDMATVSPLRASFAEPPAEGAMAFPGEEPGRFWKMKL